MAIKFGMSKPTMATNSAFSFARKAKEKGYAGGGMVCDDDDKEGMSKEDLLSSLYNKKMFTGGKVHRNMDDVSTSNGDVGEYPDDLEELEQHETTDDELGPTMEHTSSNENTERKKLLSRVFVQRFMRR